MGSKKSKAPNFIMVEHLMRKSPVWLSLSRRAIQVYLFLRSNTVGSVWEASIKDIKKPYSIIAKETALTRQQVREALLELDSKGLIDLAERGGMKSGGKTTSIYNLSVRFLKWNTPEFKPGTMKVEHFNDRGWAVYHRNKKQRASMESHTTKVRKKIPVGKGYQIGIVPTGMNNDICNPSCLSMKTVTV